MIGNIFCLKFGTVRNLALAGFIAFHCVHGAESTHAPTGGISTNLPETNEEASPIPIELWAEQQLLASFQRLFDVARQQRLNKQFDLAESGLIQLLEGRAPEEIKRPALLELAFLKHEQKEWQKAQLLYAEFGRRYPRDPSVPELLFRQATIYRELGVPSMALTKFYAVISTCLNLQLGEIEYYKKLVLKAQQEIAETHYLRGDMAEAADYFGRLLKLDAPDLNRPEILYKLARAQAGAEAWDELVGTVRQYLEKFAGTPDTAEMRFFLADGLKKLGRNKEALEEILILLQQQEEHAKANPELWGYWQQKAGNDIANQLYREGDYLSALRIYETLAGLNDSPGWQLPAWYQIGLVYENLKQSAKAVEVYERILIRANELKERTPAMETMMEMAVFRKQNLEWEASARVTNQKLQAEMLPNSIY